MSIVSYCVSLMSRSQELSWPFHSESYLAPSSPGHSQNTVVRNSMFLFGVVCLSLFCFIFKNAVFSRASAGAHKSTHQPCFQENSLSCGTDFDGAGLGKRITSPPDHIELNDWTSKEKTFTPCKVSQPGLLRSHCALQPSRCQCVREPWVQFVCCLLHLTKWRIFTFLPKLWRETPRRLPKSQSHCTIGARKETLSEWLMTGNVFLGRHIIVWFSLYTWEIRALSKRSLYFALMFRCRILFSLMVCAIWRWTISVSTGSGAWVDLLKRTDMIGQEMLENALCHSSLEPTNEKH